MGEPLLAGLSGVSSALVLGPSVEATVDEECKRLLDGSADAVLVVTFADSPADWVARWRDRIGALPERLVVVSTNDSFAGPADGEFPDALVTESLSSPADLTGLGMVLSKYLERWHEAGHDVAVCFDSVTTLLQYEDVHNVYRFLHLITTRLSGAGAHAHFHLDPATQDEQTISTLASTFQAVAEYDSEDESWAVSTR